MKRYDAKDPSCSLQERLEDAQLKIAVALSQIVLIRVGGVDSATAEKLLSTLDCAADVMKMAVKAQRLLLSGCEPIGTNVVFDKLASLEMAVKDLRRKER